MGERKFPWMFVVIAVLAATQAPRLAPTKEDKEPAGPTIAQIQSGEAVPDETVPGWKAPLRVYQEFFGLPVTASRAKSKTSQAADLEVEGRRLRFWVEESSPRTERTEASTLERIRDLACGEATADKQQLRAPTAADGTLQRPPSAPKPGRGREKAQQGQTYRLEFLIALVPDPLDTNLALEFDQALDGLQLAYADQRFLLDRQFFPWTGDEASQRTYRTTPGLLLYRREESKDARCSTVLSSVFLVGESPKQGIHKEAFLAALSLIRALQAGLDKEPTVRIVGPSLSGSAFSLRQTLRSWWSSLPEGDPRPEKILIVTGSATSPKLEADFEELDGQLGNRTAGDRKIVDFERTVLREDSLLKWAKKRYFFPQGWNTEQFVNLSESDTLFGQNPKDESNPQDRARSRDLRSPPDSYIEARFPSGMAKIRSAWEEDEKLRSQPNKILAALPRSGLGPILDNKTNATDVVPQLGRFTVPSNDATLTNLLDRLRWEGVRYVWIRASDTDDRIFLAKHVRRSIPGAIVVLNGNFLLYAHGEDGAQLQGTLVVNSFPLTLENENWRGIFTGSASQHYRRQFASSFQEGAYLAATRLLQGNKALPGNKPADNPPQVGWLAAVGGGKLWPVTLLGEVKEVNKVRSQLGFASQDRRNDLTLLAILTGLFLLAYWLKVLRRPPSGQGSEWPNEPAFRYMVGVGSALLALMSGAVFIVATLPFWGFDSGAATAKQKILAPVFEAALGAHWAASLAYLAALSIAYFCTLYQLSGVMIFRHRRGRSEGARRFGKLLPLGIGVAILIGLRYSLQALWMVGGAELFDLRARYFSSGLSPLPPWLLLGLAVFLWLVLELFRGRHVALQAVGWPIPADSAEPSLEGSSEIANSLDRMLRSTLPNVPFLPRAGESRAERAFLAPKSRFWLGLAIALVPPLLHLLFRIRPICEVRPSGWLFLGLLTLCTVIGASSFRQFLVSWLTLEKLLRRLAGSHLKQAFERLRGQITWQPMHSFGWRLPSFDMIRLSVQKLDEGWGFGGKVDRDLRAQISQELRNVFRADTDRDLVRENDARNKLNGLLQSVSCSLSPMGSHRGADEFQAIRVAAFLRPAFVHLRYCLAQAMTTFLLALFGVASYAFQPKWFALLGLWTAIVAGVALTFWAFIQMDRDPTLSAIGGTDSGRVTFDRHFFWNIFNWGALPMLAAIAVYFPEVGRFLGYLLRPILGLSVN